MLLTSVFFFALASTHCSRLCIWIQTYSFVYSHYISLMKQIWLLQLAHIVFTKTKDAFLASNILLSFWLCWSQIWFRFFFQGFGFTVFHFIREIYRGLTKHKENFYHKLKCGCRRVNFFYQFLLSSVFSHQFLTLPLSPSLFNNVVGVVLIHRFHTSYMQGLHC